MRIVPLLLLATSSLMLSACDLANTDTQAPDPISADVFSYNTNFFTSTASTKQVGPNYTNAALRVIPVSIVLGAHLVIPSLVTGAALQANPELEGNLWTWRSTATFNNQAIDFVLTANTRGLNTDWEMTVTYYDQGTDQIYDNHVLYTAQTRNNGSEGDWSLFYDINGTSQNVLNASFTRSSSSQKSLQFSIPQSATNNPGDSVVYDVVQSTRVFTWDQVSATSETVVVWDANTGEGTLIAPNSNGGEPACWDANKDDTPCQS